jgi:hypothetical protein
MLDIVTRFTSFWGTPMLIITAVEFREVVPRIEGTHKIKDRKPEFKTGLRQEQESKENILNCIECNVLSQTRIPALALLRVQEVISVRKIVFVLTAHTL